MVKLPLVGPAYKLRAQSMSCQNCINWYPQTIEYPNGSRVAALMPTPGLKRIFEGDFASVRCLHVLSNGDLLAVIGKKLYHSKSSKFELNEIGQISALGTVRVADNGQIALIVNGTYTYALDLLTLSIERLSGSTIPRSTHVLFLDGRFVLNKHGTGQFYWSDLYSTKIDALSYATAESTPDNITAIISFNRELWLFGSQSVERYYGTGSANAPFARLSGGAMAFGCVAPDSIVSLSTGVIWLGVSEFGGNQIVMSAGGIPERISTHAIEEEISVYSKTSDAMAYAYQQEGHVFYVISFPSANSTFCFDVSTGLWHQRSFANAQGLHERHRSQHHAFFRNMHIVGDYRNGKLYDLDNQTFTDDGELILRERTAQAVNTEGSLTRFNKLEIVCETGFGVEKRDIPDPEPFSCDGAISMLDIDGLGGLWDIYLNDSLISKDIAWNQMFEVLINFDIQLEFIDDSHFRFSNLSANLVRLKLTSLSGQTINPHTDNQNPTFSFENGELRTCLAPFVEDVCLAEYIKPIFLNNTTYDYQDSDVLCVTYKITDLDRNIEIGFYEFERPVYLYKDPDFYQVPNVTDLTVPNNISSTYYSLSRFLTDLKEQLKNDFSGEFFDKKIKQETTVKQTFIGVGRETSGLRYGVTNRIGLKEINAATKEVTNTFGGVFSFTPQDYEDALRIIYGHYKPILEAAGYTVTDYHTYSVFIAKEGFQLAKTTSHDINLVINSVGSEGVNVRWEAGWMDWESMYANFVESDCIGPIKTEEDYMSSFYLYLGPIDGSEYDPNINNGLYKRSTRIEFMTYRDAGKILPTNGVDWVYRNNKGQGLIVDSCFYIESESS